MNPCPQAAAGTALQYHRAAMAFGNRLDQGQAQAGAAGGFVAGAFQPNERLEHTLAVGLGNARALIFDHHVIAVTRVGDSHIGLVAIGDRILHQVADGPLDLVGAAEDGRGGMIGPADRLADFV